jgi:hypothetical protein
MCFPLMGIYCHGGLFAMMGTMLLSSKLNIFQYADDMPSPSSLAIVLTRTCRLRNTILSQISVPGLQLVAHFRDGMKLSSQIPEFAKLGDTLVFESSLDDREVARLVL